MEKEMRERPPFLGMCLYIIPVQFSGREKLKNAPKPIAKSI